MREEFELNRARWDEATHFHTRGNVYGIEDFKAGACRLHRVEKEELGDVNGWPADLDYADHTTQHQYGDHEWQHSLSDIIGSLLGAGLVLDHFQEFPYCAWEAIAGCELVERFSDAHGYYGLPAAEPQLPLMFSIRAHKPL